MVPLILLGLALMVGVALAVRGFLAADPRTLAQTVRYGGLALAGVALVALTVAGRLGTAMAVAAFLLPMVQVWRARQRQAKAARGPSSGRTSEVETVYLRMTLDHDSGAMAGEVLHGPFKGRPLDALSPAEAMDLLEACRGEDAQSAAVLEAWLDRERPGWRDDAADRGANDGAAGGGASAGAGRAPTGSGAMTAEEAREILGVAVGATPGEIKDAHRRLMMKVHPDHGGSTYLAAKINEAKDLLLRP